MGWQGLGHDDCYPEMEIVNPYLKRDCDATARDSFLWLFEEAKKYNTVISVHGNLADEYDINKSHPEFVEASAITKYPDGNELIGEVTVTDQKIHLELKPCQAVAIKAE